MSFGINVNLKVLYMKAARLKRAVIVRIGLIFTLFPLIDK